MTPVQVLRALEAARFVPVLRGRDGASVLAAAEALLRGGCRAIEVAFTTPEAAGVIASLAARGVLVGAGTVLSAADARLAWDAGAHFLVSPHLQREVLGMANAQDKLAIPGALTPTEALAAHEAGARLVKIFPVASLGGARYLALLREPLPFLRFFATGGVTLAEAPAYLAAGALAVGVGSALAPGAAIAAGDQLELESLALAWSAALYGAPGQDACAQA